MAFIDFTALFVKDCLPLAVHQLDYILSPLVFALVSLAGILFILAFRFVGVPVSIVYTATLREWVAMSWSIPCQPSIFSIFVVLSLADPLPRTILAAFIRMVCILLLK